jgi:glutamyl/glutaminyl-tRNA synthetase
MPGNQVVSMNVKSTVVTRFAPSPTGYLHIGGARTALFNWAYSRRFGGKFILRLEDTDRKRSTEQAASQIFEDLSWLGLEWDEGPNPSSDQTDSNYLNSQKGPAGPYCQSQRLAIYDRYVDQLLASGRAYESDVDDESTSHPGTQKVVRFRTSGNAVTVIDEILGPVTVQPDELEDFVIRKSDGYATYHLAVVVDDFLMGVTHVFRAQEHLTNTPKHWALQEALGFPHPRYAHFPLIFNPDGKKMSKREKPRVARTAGQAWVNNDGGVPELAKRCGMSSQSVQEFLDGKTDHIPTAEAIAKFLGTKLPEIDVHDFRRSGYLPDVLCNYLCLLGWSPGNDLEVFDRDYFARHFDVERVGKSPARFDRKKLLKFNADAIHALAPEHFGAVLKNYGMQFHADKMASLSMEKFGLFCRAYQNRSRTLADPFTLGSFLFVADQELSFSQADLETCVSHTEGLTFLRDILEKFRTIELFSPTKIESIVEETCDELQITMPVGAQAMRVALTGGKVSPGIGDTCELLGRQSVLARIQRCINQCRQ